MNGVIIWSEHISKRAIIWCEDHGRLAFFKAEDASRWGISQKSGICLWKWRYGVFYRGWASWFCGSPAIYNGSAVRNIRILPSNWKRGLLLLPRLRAPLGTLFNSDALIQRIRVLKRIRWLEARGYKTALLWPKMQLASRCRNLNPSRKRLKRS